jgi:hypothetical protein
LGSPATSAGQKRISSHTGTPPKQLPIGKIKKKETVEAQHTVTVEEEGGGAVGCLAAYTIRKHP